MSEREINNLQLARKVGASESQVSNWRRGLLPGPKYLPKLIKKLDLTATELAELGWDARETAGA